jgi:hypothetical protein
MSASAVKRQGWEINDPNVSSRQYRATLQATYLGEGSRLGTSSQLILINNIRTGTFDVYEQGGFGGLLGLGSPIASYSPEKNQLLPLNKTAYNNYFPSNTAGQTQLRKITESGKFGTFDLANLNATVDPTDRENFEKLKQTNGYKSLANITPSGDRTPGATNQDQQNNQTPLSQPPPQEGLTEEGKKALISEISEAKERTSYESVVYPVGLQLSKQDCIKFSIIKYKPPGLQPTSAAGSREVILSENNPTIKGRTPLATIVLPIPSGIVDSNRVGWNNDTMSDLMRAAANVSESAISGGGEGFVSSFNREYKNLLNDQGALGNALTAYFVENAVGKTNILSRAYGGIINPNLELLFDGPSLREFTFNFRLTPRSEKESTMVKRIIRNFKQAMSVKRTSSSLLLKAPHTFAISYLSNNKEHPYLNKFKECALVNCSVNYTPDGTYMSFNGEERSMTAYELNLSFQELEPVFDDEYGDGYSNIGF